MPPLGGRSHSTLGKRQLQAALSNPTPTPTPASGSAGKRGQLPITVTKQPNKKRKVEPSFRDFARANAVGSKRVYPYTEHATTTNQKGAPVASKSQIEKYTSRDKTPQSLPSKKNSSSLSSSSSSSTSSLQFATSSSSDSSPSSHGIPSPGESDVKDIITDEDDFECSGKNHKRKSDSLNTSASPKRPRVSLPRSPHNLSVRSSPFSSLSTTSPRTYGKKKSPKQIVRRDLFGANSSLSPTQPSLPKPAGFLNSSSTSSLSPSVVNSKKDPSSLNSTDFGVRRTSMPRAPLYFNTWSKKSETNSKLYSPTIQSNVRGIRNLGNSCYVSAVLQGLLSLSPFTESVSNRSLEAATPSSAKIFHSLIALARNRQAKLTSAPQCALDIMDAVSEHSSLFTRFTQEDAHEFLCGLLNFLDDELQSLFTKKGNDKNSAADNGSPSGLPLTLCPTDANFSCQIEHMMTCLTCRHAEPTFETFRDLSLPLPSKLQLPTIRRSIPIFAGEESNESEPREVSASIQTVLQSFFSEEVVERKCDKCKGQTANVRHHITILPRILVLHLKRFQPNVSRNIMEKLSMEVDMPLELNIENFCKDKETYAPLSMNSNFTPPLVPLATANPLTSPTAALLGSKDVGGEWISSKPSSLSITKEAESDSWNEVVEYSPIMEENEEKSQEKSQGDMTVSELKTRGKPSRSPCSDKWIDRDKYLSHGKLAEAGSRDFTYTLKSFVVHQGSLASVGHYISFIKDSHGADNWLRCDDSNVDVVSEETAFGNLSRRNGYIFFYVHNSCADIDSVAK